MEPRAPDALKMKELSTRFSKEPLAQAFGITLVELSTHGVVLEMPVEDSMLVVSGAVQGGILAVLADYASVYAAMSTLPVRAIPDHTPLKQCSLTFHKKVTKKDGILRAIAKIIHAGKSTVDVGAVVMNGNHERKATFIGTYQKLS